MSFYNETHICVGVGGGEKINVRLDDNGYVHVKWLSGEEISRSSVNFSGSADQLKNFFLAAVREIVTLCGPTEPVDRDEIFDEELI